MKLDLHQILPLIPQRYPFVMVDSADADSDSCVALLTVVNNNWFVEHGVLLEAGIIEHQAQSVAVCLGLAEKGLSARISNIGYIAEIKNLMVTRLPKVGECLCTTVNMTAAVDNVLLIDAETCISEELIATSHLKIFLFND